MPDKNHWVTEQCTRILDLDLSLFRFADHVTIGDEVLVQGHNDFVGASRGYTDHYQGRGHSIRPTAALINIHEHLI